MRKGKREREKERETIKNSCYRKSKYHWQTDLLVFTGCRHTRPSPSHGLFSGSLSFFLFFRWLQLRLEGLGAVVICSVALIVVWQRAAADSATDGSEGPSERAINALLGPEGLKVCARETMMAHAHTAPSATTSERPR